MVEATDAESLLRQSCRLLRDVTACGRWVGGAGGKGGGKMGRWEGGKVGRCGEVRSTTNTEYIHLRVK